MSETAEVTRPAGRHAPRTPEKPYYRALRTLTVQTATGRLKVYKRGQVVPEAKTWPRVEASVRSRRIERVE